VSRTATLIAYCVLTILAQGRTIWKHLNLLLVSNTDSESSHSIVTCPSNLLPRWKWEGDDFDTEPGSKPAVEIIILESSAQRKPCVS
jgi:hypothetical protein